VLSLHEMAGRSGSRSRLGTSCRTTTSRGIDELGVLLYGHAKNAYWYGSQLSIRGDAAARALPERHWPAGDLAVLAGIVWMLENPDRGIVEATEMDFHRCSSCSGPISAGDRAHTDWTPLQGRGELFPETVGPKRSVAIHERARELKPRTRSETGGSK